MLSTVSINAVGSTGEEVLVVTAAGAEVFSATVSSSGDEFTFDVDDSLSVSDLRINFVNDFFEPGVKDRNLTIQEIRFDGNRFSPTALNVFSTGTWRAEDGVRDGFGRGNILHSNGYFQVVAAEQIEFNGEIWNTSRPLSSRDVRVDTFYNELVLSGNSGEDFAISRQIEVEPGQLSLLTVNAWRNEISGSFSDAGVGAGIDFFDAEGNKIFVLDNRSFELNEDVADPSDRIRSNQFRVPNNATTAFLWIFVEGSDQQTNIPLRLTDLRLEPAVVSGDSQPPTALISTISPGDTFFVFSVTFRDDTALPADPNVITSADGIRVIDPLGRVITPTFDSTTQFGATSQSITFLVNSQSIGAPSELVSGAYEVRLLSDTVVDAAGNFAEGQSLGNIDRG